MTAFRGNHPAKVDEEGRLKLPAPFKKLLDAPNVTQFYITSTDGKSAEIWPLPEWEKQEALLARVQHHGRRRAEVFEPDQLLRPAGGDGQPGSGVCCRRFLRENGQAGRRGGRSWASMNRLLKCINQEFLEQSLPANALTDERSQGAGGSLKPRVDG